MGEPLTILVPARDEEDVIGETVRRLHEQFPGVEVIVADDGSRDATAELAEAAGAIVLRLGRRGKGQALSAGERAAAPGALLLVDADLRGDVRSLVADDGALRVAAFTRRIGGGFGIAKRTSRALIRLRSGFEAREPLSGQRYVPAAMRADVFPAAPGFGVETRMTIDAVRSGHRVDEVEIDLDHRLLSRSLTGHRHRFRQLLEALLAAGPLRVNYRGDRIPLVGWVVAFREPAVTAIGLFDDAFSGPERGFRAHLRAGHTTGVVKLIGIPLVALARTRSLSGALLVSLCANAVNQLDTKPGRALKAYLLAGALVDAPLGLAVCLLPYDLREMGMLGDGGANGLGALLGWSSVSRLTGRGRWIAIGALAGLTLLGERRSLGELIERTPVLRELDEWGRR